MEGIRTLWLFILLNQLPFCHTDTNQNHSTIQTHLSESENQGGSTTPIVESGFTTTDDRNFTNSINGTRADCLMDTEMGLIAIGTAGGLIVCLLVAIIVLAWQVCQLQRRVYVPRTSRSNMDLVSGTGYWGTDRPEIGGLVGPCDTSVMLEEVTGQDKIEEEKQAEIQAAMEEARLEEGATAMAFDPEDRASQIRSSSSRDSCLEIPRDLEDMPLVV